MAVTAEDVAEARRLAAEMPEDAGPLVFNSLAEILGYVVACSRAEGHDEADMVELFARAAPLSQREIREAERVLRPLGYRLVADRLKVLAPRAPRPKPPMTFTKRWALKIGR
jgi:hypothetical protein